jgi:benzylsuccinate CoA-transferase BbsF subunit
MSNKGKLPLEGLRVADFGRLVNAPMTVKYLGDYGATVVQIESPLLAPSRTMFPFYEGKPGLNRSGTYAAYNSSKYSITLNFKNPRGLEVSRRILKWADVMIENFAPGTKEKWGLSYEDVRKINPKIIMVSSSMLGETGPYAMQRGVGEQLCGLAGLTYITGWPDRVPAGVPNAYPDFVVPFYIISAIMGALINRKETGKGCYIDIAQFETAISFLTPALLNYTVNGKIQGPAGNSNEYSAPHGVYKCRGDDRWCAIAVFTDDEWRSFCKAIGNPEWVHDPRFSDFSSRKENEEDLNRLIEQWTINYSAVEVMNILQSAGVAAGVVQNGEDLSKDPQLRDRNHFVSLNQPGMGVYAHEASSFKLSKTPANIRPAPRFGEHTKYVCLDILNMTQEEFDNLLNEGAFTGPLLEKNEMKELVFNQ